MCDKQKHPQIKEFALRSILLGRIKARDSFMRANQYFAQLGKRQTFCPPKSWHWHHGLICSNIHQYTEQCSGVHTKNTVPYLSLSLRFYTNRTYSLCNFQSLPLEHLICPKGLILNTEMWECVVDALLPEEQRFKFHQLLEWSCNASLFISSYLLCNDVIDCEDNSDESFCSKHKDTEKRAQVVHPISYIKLIIIIHFRTKSNWELQCILLIN